MDYWSIRGVSDDQKSDVICRSKLARINIGDFMNFVVSQYIFALCDDKQTNQKITEGVKAKLRDIA